MFGKRSCISVVLVLAGLTLVTSSVVMRANGPALTEKEALGKAIFFDATLSLNANQSCAVCHGPGAGWTGPDSTVNAGTVVYEGSIAGRFGDRKPPSSAYATFSPILHLEVQGNRLTWVGGNFWDGRATGQRLGSPAAEQALGPFLNPMEQALSSAEDVVSRVCVSSYENLFTTVCGPDACADGNTLAAYDCIGYAIAAYEASAESNAFSSKYDAFVAGLVDLTKEEKKGLNLFRGKGKCSKCHTLDQGTGAGLALFTDFTFDNLGLPKNPENPFYLTHPDYVDVGLGGFLASLEHPTAGENMGKHKVPTLRNVDKRPYPLFVKAFGHNGYFKSLESIVHFYNTRDVKAVCPGDYKEAQALAANCWPAPEVAENLNTSELGNLHLLPDQEAAIVAFLKTLSDGYVVPVTSARR